MSSDLSRIVGRRVRMVRTMVGETLADLGSTLGVTHAQASRLEQGATEWTLAKLDEAAECYGMRAYMLVADSAEGLQGQAAEVVQALIDATAEPPVPFAQQRLAAALLPMLVTKRR